MNWLRRILPSIQSSSKKGVPEGIWHKCTACQAVLYRAELEKNLHVCPKCKHHLRFNIRQRIDSFLDKSGLKEFATDIKAKRSSKIS